MGLLKKLFGTSSERELKAIKPIVDKIEALDGEYSKLTDEQLKAKTPEFKERIRNGEDASSVAQEMESRINADFAQSYQLFSEKMQQVQKDFEAMRANMAG